MIQSVTQRWLYNEWTRLRAGHLLPLWKDLPAEELMPQVETLLFCDVVTTGGKPRFLIRFLGKRMMQSYGGDRRGEYLDEVLPPAWVEGALATYYATVERRAPLYNVVPTGDRDGIELQMERLLLPFSHDRIVVDRILASVETVSLEGRFQQQGLGASPFIRGDCEAVHVIEQHVASAVAAK